MGSSGKRLTFPFLEQAHAQEEADVGPVCVESFEWRGPQRLPFIFFVTPVSEVAYNPLSESQRVAKMNGLSGTCVGFCRRAVATETKRKDAETLASALGRMRKHKRKASRHRCQLLGNRRHGGDADRASIWQDGEAKPCQFHASLVVSTEQKFETLAVPLTRPPVPMLSTTAQATNHGFFNGKSVTAQSDFECETIKGSTLYGELFDMEERRQTSNCSHMSSTSTSTTRMCWSVRGFAATTKLTSVSWQELTH